MTGAHFNPIDLRHILIPIREQRGDPDCDQWSKYIVVESCNVSSTSQLFSDGSENFEEDITAEQFAKTSISARTSQLSNTIKFLRTRNSDCKLMFVKTFESLRGDVAIQSQGRN